MEKIGVRIIQVSIDELKAGDLIVSKIEDNDKVTYSSAKVLKKGQTFFNKLAYIVVEKIGKVYQHRQNSFKKIAIEQRTDKKNETKRTR